MADTFRGVTLRGGRRAGGMSISVDNIAAVNARLEQLAKQDLNVARRELRQGTKKIAEDYMIPALKMGARSSGVPIAAAMADTARARTDRIVTVRIGTVNPKLSGFKRGIGQGKARVRRQQKSGRAMSNSSQSYRTTLAWGSDRGPYKGADVNHYAVPRSKSHWVIPTLNAPGTMSSIKRAYQDLLDKLLRDYGADR